MPLTPVNYSRVTSIAPANEGSLCRTAWYSKGYLYLNSLLLVTNLFLTSHSGLPLPEQIANETYLYHIIYIEWVNSATPSNEGYLYQIHNRVRVPTTELSNGVYLQQTRKCGYLYPPGQLMSVTSTL
jgi:hypothetical protein